MGSSLAARPAGKKSKKHPDRRGKKERKQVDAGIENIGNLHEFAATNEPAVANAMPTRPPNDESTTASYAYVSGFICTAQMIRLIVTGRNSMVHHNLCYCRLTEYRDGSTFHSQFRQLRHDRI